MNKTPSPFGYYGGKGKVIDFIVENIPPNPKGNFLDLFGGSGVVSFAMVGHFRQVVYNDINSRLYNFFKTLRAHPELVQDMLELTSACRQDFEESWEISEDPIEDARRVFVRINCSFMKKGLWQGPNGWQFHGLSPNRSTTRFLRSKIASLPAVAEILQSIDIENRDWRGLAKKATKHTTIFADPPYDMASRSGGRGYEHEMTEEDHRDLFSMLSKSPADSFVCGYRSDLYDELYKEWILMEKPLNNNYQATTGKPSTDKVECLWINPMNSRPTKNGVLIK